MRILVIRLSSLGDVVLTAAPLQALSSLHPGAEIVLATRHEYAALFDAFEPSIAVVPFTSATSLRGYARLLGGQFDLVVDLHGTLRSRLLCSMLDSVETRRLNKHTLRRWRMVWSKTGLDRPLSAVRSYLDTVNADHAKPWSPRLFLLPDERDEAQQLHSGSPTIGIGWGARHSTKSVPAEFWQRLVGTLSSHGPLRFKVFGLPVDRDSIEQSLGTEYAPLEILINQPLRQTMIHLAACDAFIASDSGLMHLAAAVDVPTVGLFGPTHPSLGFAPSGNHAFAFHAGTWCSPCHRHGSAPCFRERRFCFDGLDIGGIVETVRSNLPSGATVGR